MLVKNNHLTQSSHVNHHIELIYFNTATRNMEKISKEVEKKKYEEMEVIRSVTSDLFGGIRVSGTAAGGRRTEKEQPTLFGLVQLSDWPESL